MHSGAPLKTLTSYSKYFLLHYLNFPTSHGIDADGAPTLWYRIERMEWDKIILKKRMEYTDIVLQHGMDVMALSNIHDFNFVMMIDDFSPMNMLRHPRIGPAFMKTFIKRTTGGESLKRAIMVTGSSGIVFYNIAKTIAPRSFMEKISVVKSRDEAADLLLKLGILQSEDDVPSFLGRQADHSAGTGHPDEITKNLSMMMSTLKTAMSTGWSAKH